MNKYVKSDGFDDENTRMLYNDIIISETHESVIFKYKLKLYILCRLEVGISTIFSTTLNIKIYILLYNDLPCVFTYVYISKKHVKNDNILEGVITKLYPTSNLHKYFIFA